MSYFFRKCIPFSYQSWKEAIAVVSQGISPFPYNLTKYLFTLYIAWRSTYMMVYMLVVQADSLTIKICSIENVEPFLFKLELPLHGNKNLCNKASLK